ncbi:MAG TPA: YqiA/YcfP family alpha/beta fold hydrolase [Variovorax sp.]|nr:YqiA/YcfP family alpha/beta fold hydrolase [Variovorax sp.]
MSSTTTHLLYLHGFRSSPRSAKAQIMARHVAAAHPAVQWWAPQLPPSPGEAMEMVMSGIRDWPLGSMAVVGSSLGGFYATHVAATTSCRAVLLNPAVHPARDLARYIGDQTQWHAPEEHFYFKAEYIDELRALEVGALPHPERCLSIVAKGDEVLDWNEMVARYPGIRIKLLEGGDHALSDFEVAHLRDAVDFLHLA